MKEVVWKDSALPPECRETAKIHLRNFSVAKTTSAFRLLSASLLKCQLDTLKNEGTSIPRELVGETRFQMEDIFAEGRGLKKMGLSWLHL